MKNTIKIPAAIILSTSLLFAGCGAKTNNEESTAKTVEVKDISELKEVVVEYKKEDYAFDWKAEAYETINVSSDETVINKSGVYEITGTMKDGSLVIDVDKDTDDGVVYLVLNNVNINSEDSAPIYVKDAEKVVLLLEEGTTNTVTQGKDVQVNADNEPSAAIFSKAHLTITGSGSLKVTSEYNDGITSKDTLKMTEGTLEINAEKDGIVGKDLVGIENGNVTITAGKHGIRSTNEKDEEKGSIGITGGTFAIDAQGDGLQAYNVLYVADGDFTIKTAGGAEANTSNKSGDGMGQPPTGDGTNQGTPPEPPTGDGTNQGTPPEPPTGDGTNQGTPPEPPTGDGTNQGTRPERPTGDGTNQGTRPERPTGNGENQGTQSESSTDSGTTSEETTTDDSQSSNNGLQADIGILVAGGNFTISSYDDGLHTNGNMKITGGTYSIDSGDDALHADGMVHIVDGEITINQSYEGIEGTDITIDGGNIHVTSSDDGMNVNDESGLLTITNGNIYIDASGDGIDSNGDVKMTGGVVYVDGPVFGADSGIDYDGTFDITGGEIIATGQSSMAQGFSEEGQNGILMYFSQAQEAGKEVSLVDESGETVISFTPSKTYTALAASSSDLEKGKSYTLKVDGKEIVSFTVSNAMTYLNESGETTKQSNQGGPGGQGGKGSFNNTNTTTSNNEGV